MKKCILIIALSLMAAVGGCSADAYRRWADQQVDQIVHERSEETLGYAPEVVTPVTVSAAPTTQAYSKVPTSPHAPATTAPIQPDDGIVLLYGVLGPEMLFPTGVQPPMADTYGLEILRLRVGERLALGPPAPMQQITRLDLFGSLRYAVLHSRDYMVQMEDLYLIALDVTLQRHLFDPRPFARTGLRYNGGQETSDYAAALNMTNAVGVRQQLPYGGEVTAAATVDFVRAISGTAENGESAAIALAASIPLLKGAGMVNLEPLIQSERDVVYQIRRFEDFRRNFAVNIASRYFILLAEQQSIADRASNQINTQTLTERSQALYAAGKAKFIDVQRALQSQLQAEQLLINAQARFRDNVDDFKLALGMPVDQPLEIVSQELAVTVPNYAEREVADLAIQYRLDISTSKDRVEDAQRNVQVAKNGLLPQLDVNAAGRFGNLVNNPAIEFDNDTSAYSAGIDLDIPIDRVAERNRYRSSLIQLERSQRSYEQLRDHVSAAARQSMRLIRLAEVSLNIQQKGIELAKLTLDNAYELLRQGKSDNRNVVDAQNALIRAQEEYEKARATLQIQVLQFLRDTGTLRVDPDAGAIGHALDRKVIAVNEPAPGR